MAAGALTAAFNRFVESERSGGILLLACTLAAFALANSPAGAAWLAFWQAPIAGLTVQLWVNDALIAVFFLLVGLELEREIYVGELSPRRRGVGTYLVGGVSVRLAASVSRGTIHAMGAEGETA